MKFLNPAHASTLELALEDVFITPGFYSGTSCVEVDLTCEDFPGSSHPVVSANMNAVTGKRMAEAMARYGGLGVVSQDLSLETVERIVQHVKQADPRYDTALYVTVHATLRDALCVIRKRAHDLVVVVDEKQHPVGILRFEDVRGSDPHTPVTALMSSQFVTIAAGTTNRDAFLLMEEHHIKAAPVLQNDGRLLGVLTREDCVRQELLRPSLDAGGQLMVAAAVDIGSSQVAETASRLLKAGISALVLDTTLDPANGHQRRMLESIREVRSVIGKTIPLIAGNVCTAQGTADLIAAGADIVKVNIGPGAMCSTRMQTGAGRPTFTSVLTCARVAREHGKHVWADGGVRHPRDIALYLAAGASRVMVGTAMAATFESPPEVKEDSRGLYKESYGVASSRAVRERFAKLDAFERAKKTLLHEGISTSRVSIREGRESVSAVLADMVTSIQSSCTYIGAQNLKQMHEMAIIGVQTPAGYYEGTPHGISR